MATMHLTLLADSPFSYDCKGCGRCCYQKSISVNPYETLRIARALKLSTTEVLERFVDSAQTLRRKSDGSCVFLEGNHCGVHQARPAACRIYPLAMVETSPDVRRFGRLPGHPLSEGVWGSDDSVARFLHEQGLHAFDEAFKAYRRVFARLVSLVARLEVTNVSVDDDVSWIDVDAALGESTADDAEVAFLRHVALLEKYLDRLESIV